LSFRITSQLPRSNTPIILAIGTGHTHAEVFVGVFIAIVIVPIAAFNPSRTIRPRALHTGLNTAGALTDSLLNARALIHGPRQIVSVAGFDEWNRIFWLHGHIGRIADHNLSLWLRNEQYDARIFGLFSAAHYGAYRENNDW
jgi:hypothetical protein